MVAAGLSWNFIIMQLTSEFRLYRGWKREKGILWNPLALLRGQAHCAAEKGVKNLQKQFCKTVLQKWDFSLRFCPILQRHNQTK